MKNSLECVTALFRSARSHHQHILTATVKQRGVARCVEQINYKVREASQKPFLTFPQIALITVKATCR